ETWRTSIACRSIGGSGACCKALARCDLCALARDATGRLGMYAHGYLVVLYGSLHLPKRLPHDGQLHAVLLTTHIVLSYMVFATSLRHVAAALFHGWTRRDGVFRAMAGIGPRNQ